MELLIRGGRVASSQGVYRADVLVRNGRVAAVAEQGLSAAEVVDAGSLLVLPGMVDTHTHFMDPGDLSREDFPKGSSAAAVGGVTTLIEHTHGTPVRSADELRKKTEYLRDRSVVDFGLAAHIWNDRINEIDELWAAGATYFKVFTNTTFGLSPILPGYLIRLFRRVADIGAICLVHCEDESMLTEREAALRAEGREDFNVILEWRTREAEVIASQAVATLARMTAARTVIAHATHPAILDVADRERRAGAHLSVESVPRYFYIREDEILKEGAFRKFAPPARARNEQDEQAMWQALSAGRIDHISSDHSPSTPEQKRKGSIWEVPFGIPGVENTLPLMLNAVHERWLTLPRLVEVLCEVPAKTYGLYPRKGVIQVGSDADFMLIDPDAAYTFSHEQTISKAGWTPYHGRTVHGRVIATYLRGRLVAREGRPVADPGYGIFLPGPGASGRTVAS